MSGRRPWVLVAGVLVTVVSLVGMVAGADDKVPTMDEMISLKWVGSPALSPDGRRVAYTVRETNWEEDAYETEIWIADVGTGEARQLTFGRKSSSAPAWSPDGKRLAFVSDREGKRQIYVINLAGGEAEALTKSEEGISAFEWAPDGGSIAFTQTDPVPEDRKDRDKKYGEFEVIDADHRLTHLHVVDVASKAVRKLTSGGYTVGSFTWSPDGRTIAFDHQPTPDPSMRGDSNISIVTVASASVSPLVTQEGPDRGPVWAPDGHAIAFSTSMANPWHYYANDLIATIPSSGGTITPLTRAFDEDANPVAWGPGGIYFWAWSRTSSHLYRLDPKGNDVTRLGDGRAGVVMGFSFSQDFSRVAYVGADASSMEEVFVAPVATMQGRPMSRMSDQIKGWRIGTREVVRWTSKDGTEIEGVLHKPDDFQAGRRYPLLVVTHGGPTGVSLPVPRLGGVYPITQWLAKGALVLEPNYRGSAGYGEKFRALNVRNLGVGDAWDVISGIDALVERGLVDNARVGAMGWSQGGYISAFLTTHDSARFKAISVGAGISNWVTYYVNTDIHPFTRQYLRATPWDDPAIYAKTSPMTYIKQASAPTLIQHGENDQRVPPPNAFELYQGLQDQGVPVKLIIYKGFGHGLNKPKATRAAMEHNWEWFDEHLWNATPAAAAGEPRR